MINATSGSFSANPQRINNKRILNIWQYGIFILFYLLCCRFIFSSFYQSNTSQIIQLSILFFMAAGLILCNLRLALFCFIAFIPLISGLQGLGILKNTSLLSFSFSSMYIAWFSKGILLNKLDLQTNGTVGVLINLLITVIFLSLLNLLLTYSISDSLHTLLYFPFINPQNDLYGITASFIILQGLFFYRLIEIESDTLKLQNKIYFIFSIHALTILFYALIQLVWEKPSTLNLIALYSPFEDIHSFGSYIAFIFLFFINASSLNIYNLLNNSIAILFFVLIFLSYSKATWGTVIIVTIAFFYNKISLRKYITLIALIVSIIFFFNIFPSSIQNSKNSYLNRFSHLILVTRYFDSGGESNLSRLALYKRAINMIMQFPIVGRGIGTFYKLSPTYSSKGDPFAAFQENTHNYFLQIAAEIGIPALLIFLSIIYYTFKLGIQVIREDMPGSFFIKGCLFGLSVYLLTCMTGHPLLLLNQQFLFWFIIASITLYPSLLINQKHMVTFNYQRLIFLFLTILVVGYAYNMTKPNDLLQKIYGTYSWENISGQKVCWTGKESSAVLFANSNLVRLKVVTDKFNIDDKGLFFKAFINNSPIIEHHFFRPEEKLFYCYLPNINAKEFTLKTTVDKTFCPKDIGLNNDSRELGIMMSPVAFLADLLPEEGIGFYDWETWSAAPSPDWPKNVPVRIRWTGLRASMDVENYSNRGMTLFLYAAHPDIQRFPVTVKITGDNKIIREELFNNIAWKRVELTPEELKDSTSITFEVSRTWNPKLSGFSDDPRDLGIAVAIPEQWHANIEKTMLAELKDGSRHNQQDRSLLLNIIPHIQLAMDFSRIIKKKDVLYALSGLTRQKAIIRGTTTLVDGPKRGSHALFISRKDVSAMVNFSPFDINTQEGSLSIWACLENPLKEDSCLIAVHSQNTYKIISIDHNGSDGGFTVYYNGSEAGKSTISITDTNWHHYVFTWKNGEQKFYIDSEEALSCAKKASSDMATRLNIGGRQWALNQWTGAVASFFIFNRTLTNAEIMYLYRN